jgi:signal transduction histidine kinase
MELKTRRWFYLLTLLWVLLLLILGSWWLYLVFRLHETLTSLNLPELTSQERFINMIRWEGLFFFLLLVLLGGSLFIMYFRDMRKSKGLQVFFSSLSHELKTPLASMRLQAEVIKDLIEDESHSHEQLSSLTGRLIEDTHKLESEFEKTLQLSRIEQGAPLTLSSISLERYLKHHKQKLKSKNLELHLAPDADEVLADELALNVIFRNLFENTHRHNPSTKDITITTLRRGDVVELLYDDHGMEFAGDPRKLGSLFYKFNSTKGSGLGLYLIKNLMEKMKGELRVSNSPRLLLQLNFLSPFGENNE